MLRNRVLSWLLTVILLVTSLPLAALGETETAPVSPSEEIVLEEPAADPVEPEEPAADPVEPEEPAADPVEPEEPAADPVQPEEPAADPVEPEEPAADPVQPEEPAAEPVETKEPEPEPELTYVLTSKQTKIAFGSLAYDYATVTEKTLTVKNEGTGTITLKQPKSDNYELGKLSRTVLKAGQSAKMTIAPKAGLTAGSHNEKLTLRGDHDVILHVNLTVTIKAAPVTPAPTEFAQKTAVQENSPLPTPKGVAAVSKSYNSVEITWDSVSGADCYIVQRASAFTGPFTQIEDDYATTKYVDSAGITCGSTYYYRIQAKDSSQNYSSFSDVVVVTVIPVAPTLKTAASQGATSVKITWTKGVGANGYYVYRAVAGEGGYSLIATVANASTLTYTDTTVLTNIPYSYKIQSYHVNTSTGKTVVSDYSNVCTATPTPLAPTGFKGTVVNHNTVRLEWTVTENASFFILERSDTEGGAFIRIGDVIVNKNYTDTQLQTGVTYYYRVRAVVNQTESLYSKVISVRPIPAPPTGLKAASLSDTSIKLTWTIPTASGLSGYRIEMADDAAGPYTMVQRVMSPDIANATVTGLDTGKLYYFRIRSYTTAASEYVYSKPSTQVSCRAKPRVPGGFGVTVASYDRLTIEWNKVPNADGYELYRSTSSGTSTFTMIKYLPDDGSSSYTYTNTGLNTGTNYYYRVAAYIIDSGVKVYSSYSSIKNARPVNSAPENVTITAVKSDRVTLNWSQVNGASGYYVLKYNASTKAYDIVQTITSGTTLKATVTELTTGVKTYFRVRAFRTVNSKRIAGLSSTVVSATPMPGKAALKGKALKIDQIQLYWAKVNGATDYEVYSSTSKTGSFTKIKSVTDISVNLYVEPGQTLYYKVRAYCTVGTVNKYGPYSEVIGLKSAPARTTISAVTPLTETSLKITWKQQADIADRDGGYYIYRGLKKETSSMTKIATVSRTDILNYTDTTVSPYTVYFYSVRPYAVTDYGIMTGSYSPIVSNYTKPAAPKLTKVEQRLYSSLRLTWTNPAAAATGFEVFYSTSATGTYKMLGTTTKVADTVVYVTPTVLEYGKNYYFKVRAYYINSSDVTIYSGYSSYMAGRTVLPKPATVKASSYKAKQIKVSWTAVSGAQGYRIYISSKKDSDYYMITSVGSDKTSAVITGLVLGTKYFFKVTAYRNTSSGVREGTLSSAVNATSGPSAPTKLSYVVTGYRSVKLTWVKADGAQGYRVYRSLKGQKKYSLIADKITGTTCTLNNQETGKIYDYYVCAYLMNGTTVVRGASSNVVTTFARVLKPAKITGAFGSPMYSKLTWSKSSNASGYKVYRANASSGTFALIATLESPDTLSYTDDISGISIGTSRYYYVVPYYLNPETLKRYDGYRSATVTVMRAPATPKSLKGTKMSNTSIKLTWTLGADADGYRIYRSTSPDGTYTQIDEVGKIETYINTGLRHGRTYYYKIRAIKLVNGKAVLSNHTAYVAITP